MLTVRMHRVLAFGILSLAVFGCACPADSSQELAISTGASGKTYLTQNGAPLFAFGPGDEMRLLSGAADIERWAKWQKANGMNLVRAYPASVPVEAYGAPGLHPFKRVGEKWDVDAWNDAYFEHLGEAAHIMERHGIILHLQLWQIVWFKGGSARWDINYLNPGNNANEWTQGFARGRDYIDAPPGSAARAHQREWVRRLLDAVAHRGNVWIDVINELGNEMGTLAWAAEVVGWIREWEAENNRTFIVGVDSEHHYRPEVFDPYRDVFDIVILNELRSPAHARGVATSFNMPVVTVRSSDDRNSWDDYMFANASQTGPEHQTRYRTLSYRSLFSGVQSIGAYWKPLVSDADYKVMEHWPVYARALRSFWAKIGPEWPQLVVDDGIIEGETVAPHAYGMRSENLHVVYLECGPKSWGNDYPPSDIHITCPYEPERVELFNPRTGEFTPANAQMVGDTLHVTLPSFTDDMAVLVWREQVSDGDLLGKATPLMYRFYRIWQ